MVPPSRTNRTNFQGDLRHQGGIAVPRPPPAGAARMGSGRMVGFGRQPPCQNLRTHRRGPPISERREGELESHRNGDEPDIGVVLKWAPSASGASFRRLRASGACGLAWSSSPENGAGPFRGRAQKMRGVWRFWDRMFRGSRVPSSARACSRDALQRDAARWLHAGSYGGVGGDDGVRRHTPPRVAGI